MADVFSDDHITVYDQVVDVDSLTGRDLRAVFRISNAASETEMHACVARTMFGTCAQLTSVVTMLRARPDEPVILRSHYNEGVWDPYHVGFEAPAEVQASVNRLVDELRKPIIRSVDPSTFTVEWWYREPYYCIVPIISVDGSFAMGSLSLGSKAPIAGVQDLVAYARVVCGAISFAWERISRHEDAVLMGQSIEREHVLQTVHDSAVQDIFAAEMQLRELAQAGGLAPAQVRAVEQALAHVRAANRSLRTVLAEDAPARRQESIAFLRDLTEREVAAHREQGGVGVDIVVSETGTVPPSLVEPCRMFLREALRNVRKHARATGVVVMGAVREDTLMLTVQDDGCGGPGGPDARPESAPDVPHFGVANLKKMISQLGGTVELELQPGEGCALRMRVPMRGV